MITVSYSGVHQAFQAALAAQEANCLNHFLCSFYDAPGKWGGCLSALLGKAALNNRSIEGLLSDKVTEYPWPELNFKIRSRLLKAPSNAWIDVARRFDIWAARKLLSDSSSVVMCSENCALETFSVARRKGMICVYDVPGFDAKVLRETTKLAASMCNLSFVSVADTAETSRRKECELSMADKILVYSSIHADSLVQRSASREHIIEIPLWSDSSFWSPNEKREKSVSPLKVLYAGGINLRKGVPFLIEAVKRLSPYAKLTLVGALDPDVRHCLAGCEDFVEIIAPVDKLKLREIYREHDVLVLPSLGDSFGFVAMEAMACGTPVVVTDHCGVPVPDISWRVPILNSDVIQNRLQYYIDNPDLVSTHGVLAREFAEQFTPLRYRDNLGDLFRELLNKGNQ